MADRMQFRQADGSLVNVTPYYHVGGGVVAPITSFKLGDKTPINPPLAPALSTTTSVLTSRTAATINWTAPVNTGRPEITGYLIYRNGVQVGSVGPTVTTFSESGLPTATPENVFNYTVRATNAGGLGAQSNIVSLQWNTVILQTPTALSNLARGVMTSTSVPLTWTGTTDTSVTKQGIFENGVLVRDNLDPALRSYSYSGLTAGSVHNNVTVRRANVTSGGVTQWSPDSNVLSFTTPSGSAVALAHDPAMGTSFADEPSPFTISAAVRCYTTSKAMSDVDDHKPRVIAVSDSGISTEGGQASADKVKAFLESFYYSGGTPIAARADIEIHWANGNEIDGDYSGAVPAAWFTTHRLMYDAVHTLNSNGTRRYPKASMWIDMTQYNIRTGGTGQKFKPAAQYLDGFASSMYPPGRSKDPVVFNPYADYCDMVLDTCKDWMDTGGAGGGKSNITQFATWEIGIPIDHADKGKGTIKPGISATNGAPTAQTDITVRPRYMTGGIDASGHDWKGYLQYIYEACDARGIIMREQIYWNQQSNPDIPNQFKHDTDRTTPNTGNAWNDWVPGKRLPRG